MRISTSGLAVFISALLLLALAPSVAAAQVTYTIKAGDDNDTGAWQLYSNAGGANCMLQPGTLLAFSFDPNTSGRWQEGNTSTGPAGPMKSWPDNFLNVTDLGKVGQLQAKTYAQYFEALVGYIGDPTTSPPPERGSYASSYSTPEVRAAAQQVFPIFPMNGTSSFLVVRESGCLFLAFNADAYSDYVADNSGSVTVSVVVDTGYLARLGSPMCHRYVRVL